MSSSQRALQAGFVALLVVAFSAVILTVGDARADHHVFYQTDPSYRAKMPSPGFNAVAQPWWNFYGPTFYWSDASVPEADTAVSNWFTAWNKLTFTKVTSPTQADLTIYNLPCPGGKRGCVFSWIGPLFNPPEAYYWWPGELRIDLSNWTWSTQGKIDALNHEVGHWIGLHEQYDDDGGGLCGAVAPTVMNGGSGPFGENCQNVHLPTQDDISRAQRYWLGDNLTGPDPNFPIWPVIQETSTTSRTLRLTWKDYVWADAWHWRELYWWSGTGWVYVANSGGAYQGNGLGTNTGIGFHHDAVDRTMNYCCWDLQLMGQPIPGYYRGCMWYWTFRGEVWTGGACAGYAYVD
jgi:hypothetical protein